ncbi:efflux RND transporter periplasmic adaptor subunit [Pusillimonas sp. DMV24BSW_D]|uniref:efflux RND transporter periplasmic adaptor subunit n=1 Tax=Neopusillimonas aestuarii TaxID=2716226 RepID=UPI0014089972|nr:efflux RND transporter periplasmic adaptor subunit [Pusillimonas sp. DMV24BSW_D]QIM49666.1 efflux RND transporter periplasmic adaptor subunit [Pusillimonas sp. DMV24BSW_D]
MLKPRLSGWQRTSVIVLLSAGLLAACSEEPEQKQQGMKIPVNVVTVEPTSTEVTVNLPGRVEAIKDAQIRARVNGIVTDIKFEQGGDVEQGQSLFTIDPAPYQAVLDGAKAQLLQAQADAKSARLLAQRYARLVKDNAVSRQEYDNAQAAAAQAEAAIAAGKAAVQSAQIDLGYTEVVSPIDGRIGKSYVTEGALVSATQATQLALVQQLDEVYVDITRSTSEVMQLRKALESGMLEQAPDGSAKVEVMLEDGTLYPESGKLLFSGVTVDPATGQVSLRAVFPNKDEILLPGMYVRVKLGQGVDRKALLVPQQAVQRSPDGSSTLMLVKDGKVAATPVTVGPLLDNKWLITDGLSAGDVVIVAGFQKIRPGAPVQPIPWNPDQPAGAAAGQQPNGAAKATPKEGGGPSGTSGESSK